MDVQPNELALCLLDAKDASGKPAATVCTDPVRRAKAKPIHFFAPKHPCVAIEDVDWVEQLSRQRNLSPELCELSDRIAATSTEIGLIREQIRSFQNLAIEDGFEPLALPGDWDFEKAQAELNELLQQRLSDTSKLRQLVEQSKADAAKAQEKQLSKLAKQHVEVCREVLACEIALAKVCRRERALCQEAADLVGQQCGPLQSFGPGGSFSPLHGFDPNGMMGTLATRIREALERKIINPGDPMLADLKL